MGDMGSLFAVDSIQTLQFFLDGLVEVGVPAEIPKKEVVYIAEVLAHYAQTSSEDSTHLPLANNLSEAYDRFVLSQFGPEIFSTVADPSILEVAGSQFLIIAGFFRQHMSRRYNLPYYERLGRTFYASAGHYSNEKNKKELFFSVASNFPLWAMTFQSMSRNFRDNPYLLDISKGS